MKFPDRSLQHKTKTYSNRSSTQIYWFENIFLLLDISPFL